MNPLDLPPILFNVVMGLALSGWLALIFFPRRPWANFWYAGVIVPLVLSIFFMGLTLLYWFLDPPGRLVYYLSLEGVHSLFENRGLLLVGWTDLLFVDLLVGAWMTRKAAQVRIPYIYLLPCLILTFTFAGYGFALFVLVCAAGGRWKTIAGLEGIPPVNSKPVAAIPGE